MTDDEFNSVESVDEEYTLELYTEMLGILDDRETASFARDRLKYYFQAAGVEIPSSTPAKSNIFLGSGLCS